MESGMKGGGSTIECPAEMFHLCGSFSVVIGIAIIFPLQGQDVLC